MLKFLYIVAVAARQIAVCWTQLSFRFINGFVQSLAFVGARLSEQFFFPSLVLFHATLFIEIEVE